MVLGLPTFYVRIKRQKQIFFIDDLKPTDTIIILKDKLRILTSKKPEDIRLLKLQDQPPATTVPPPPLNYVALDDSTVLDQIGIAEDSVLYMVFWVAGVADDGKWEEPNVPDFESVGGDVKGKAAA